MSYLKKQSGPASVPIKTAKEVAEFKAKPAAVVGVFKGEDAPEFKVFSDVANALRDDFDFAHTFEAKIVDEVRKFFPGLSRLFPGQFFMKPVPLRTSCKVSLTSTSVHAYGLCGPHGHDV